MPCGQDYHKWGMEVTKQVEFIIEWASTFILLAGAYLTSVNIYPMNVMLSMVGNAGWFVIAVSWRRWSLIVIQLVITLIYVSGLIKTGAIH